MVTRNYTFSYRLYMKLAKNLFHETYDQEIVIKLTHAIQSI